MWGLSVEVPQNVSHFSYRYIVTDMKKNDFLEEGPMRVLDLGGEAREVSSKGREFEQEDWVVGLSPLSHASPPHNTTNEDKSVCDAEK